MIRMATLVAFSACAAVTTAAEPETPERVRAIATQAAAKLDGWELHHLDTRPTVKTGAKEGYRLILRRQYKVYPELHRQQAAPVPDSNDPFEWRHEDWEIVLVPLGGRLPADIAGLARAIDFQPRESELHLRRVYLGTQADYALYTLAPIHHQERLRSALNLIGGDDRIQLAVDGLRVKDQGTETANSVPFILAEFGDAALPYLDRAIEDGGDVRGHILAVGKIPTSEATRRLTEWYRTGDEQQQEAAATALVFSWRREAAKPVYLQMIRDRRQVSKAAVVAAEFKWLQAIEPLEQIVVDPPSLGDYYAAFRALRALEGEPFPDQIERAISRIKEAGYASGKPVDDESVEQGVRQIINSRDTAAAIVAALELALYGTKGNSEAVSAAGMQLLRELPSAEVQKTLHSLAMHMDDANGRHAIEELLAELK